MRLEHHLVGGYVRYISPHIIIIIIINFEHEHNREKEEKKEKKGKKRKNVFCHLASQMSPITCNLKERYNIGNDGKLHL